MRQARTHGHTTRFHLPYDQEVLPLPPASARHDFQRGSVHRLRGFGTWLTSRVGGMPAFLPGWDPLDDRL